MAHRAGNARREATLGGLRRRRAWCARARRVQSLFRMTASEVANGLERATHGPWMKRAQAVGFIAKGVVYAVIGIYALGLALGYGGAFLGSEDTPKAVQRQPFGDVLLVLLGVGLACHAVWRLVSAFEKIPGKKSALKRAGKRVASLGSALIAGFLALTAFQHLAGRSSSRGSWVQRVLRHDGGDWVILAIGVGFIGAGGYQFYRAFTRKFRKDLETHEMSDTGRTWLLRISRFGIAVRGVVFLVVGWLFVQTGLHASSHKATGMGAALREIMQQTWGTWLLGIAAAGMLAYALFMMVNAGYRRALR